MHNEVLRTLTGTDFGGLRGASKVCPDIYPSNIDGVEERRGWFLWYEIKHKNEGSRTGQQRLLKELAAMPRTIVLVVRVDGSETSIGATWFAPVTYQKFWKCGDDYVPSRKVECDLTSFIGLREQWLDSANRNDGAGIAASFPIPDIGELDA